MTLGLAPWRRTDCICPEVEIRLRRVEVARGKTRHRLRESSNAFPGLERLVQAYDRRFRSEN